MVLVRAVGWLLLAMAVAAFVYDGLTWWSAGAFKLAPLGELWSRLDPGSLFAVEKSVGAQLPALWDWIMRPLLGTPALPILTLLGVLLVRAGQTRDREPEPVGFVLGSRPPRRRRRSGGLS